eukprot:1070958-Prorocentrum_minimum.AAC.1
MIFGIVAQVLVEVFSKELCAPSNAHLKEFYMILPALFLSHVEVMQHAKDKLSKRGRDAAAASFTDDGLALGAAYLLQVWKIEKGTSRRAVK